MSRSSSTAGDAPSGTEERLADMIAMRVVALLEHRAHGPRAELATAAEVAQALGVGRSWVYANKRRLGAIRLGEGARARLRFDLQQAKRALREADEQHGQGARKHLSAGACRLPVDVEMLQGRREAAGG
jgi:hypothetical protein